jgi:hypothetical protein
MLVHLVKRDVLSGQAIVAPLQNNEVIPYRRRSKQLVPQLPILLVSALQTVFVQLANYRRMVHAFGVLSPEAVVGVQASTTNLYCTRSSRKKQPNVRVRTPFGIIPSAEAQGFPAPEFYNYANRTRAVRHASPAKPPDDTSCMFQVNLL